MSKDWTAAVDTTLSGEPERLRAAAIATEDTTPDAYAEATRLGRKFDVPAQIVADATPEFAARERMDRLDRLGQENPPVAEFLRAPDRMALASDDIEELDALGRLLAPLNAVPHAFIDPERRGRLGERLKAGANATFGGIAELVGETVDEFTGPLRDVIGQRVMQGGPASATGGAMRAAGQLAAPAQVADAGRALSRDARERRLLAAAGITPPESLAAAFDDPINATDYYLGLGADSLFPMGASVATTAVAGPLAGGAVMGAATAGQAYSGYRAEGEARGPARRTAFVQGVIEALFERLPLDEAFAPATSFASRLVRTSAAESGAEVLTSLAQDTSEAAMLDRRVELASLVRNAIDSGIVGAGMGATIALPGAVAVSAREARAGRRTQAMVGVLAGIERSAGDAMRLSQITQAAAKLRLSERDPASAEAFAKHVAGADAAVYIPAADFRTLFQDGAAAMAAELTGEANALALAGELGDIVVPMAKYVATLARLPNASQIEHVARLRPDGYSRRDIEGLDFDAEIAGLEAAEPAGEEHAAAVEQIKVGVLAGLQASGRYNDADADLMASLHARVIGTLARRSGTDPKALFDRYRLRINDQPAYNPASTGDDDAAARSADARAVPDAGAVRGGAGLLAQPRGPDQGDGGREPDGSLRGLPREPGGGFSASAFGPALEVADRYREQAGIGEPPVASYARVDRERATRIAAAFEAMEHDPRNPEVAAAYAAMVAETLAQYRAILETGLTVEFIAGEDPYAGNPRAMTEDVRQNNHMWVFSTRDGFGSDATFDPVENPLLGETEFTDAAGAPMLANDVFRVVHDYFGHVKEGVGFRADGEENAWRAHAAMFSPLARRAMTTETRGQNSWVNFGPHGDVNRTASASDTIYADQKIGLLPEWASEEGRTDDRPDDQAAADARGAARAGAGEGDGLAGVRRGGGSAPADGAGAQGAALEQARRLSTPEVRFAFHPVQPDAVAVDVYHHSTTPGLSAIDPTMAGTGAAGAERRRFGMGRFGDRNPRTYWYGIGTQPEDIVPRAGAYAVTLENLYDADADPRGFGAEAGANTDHFEELVADAGFDGFTTDHAILGKVAVTFGFADPIPVQSAADMVLYQSAQAAAARNDLGLYSAAEQAVIDMPLPAWKKDGGTAKGAEVWAKLSKTPGVKAEELKWLGIEEYLLGGKVESSRDTFDDRYTREEVLAFVRNNGVRVEVIVADQEEAETGTDGDHDFNWSETIDDDPSNWEWRVEDFMYEFDGQKGRHADELHWWSWSDWLDNNQDEIRERLGETEEAYTIAEGGDAGFIVYAEDESNVLGEYVTREEAEAFVEEQTTQDYDFHDIVNHPNGGIDVLVDMARTEAEQSAEEAARQEYMDDPIVIHRDRESGVEIIGNSDSGYFVRDPDGDEIASDIYSFNEAEVRAAQWVAENGDAPASDDESKVAKWGDYIAKGSSDNYREIKLTLPDVPGSFVNSTHFDDENIVAFLRVTDRALPAVLPQEPEAAPAMPDDYAPLGKARELGITASKLRGALDELAQGTRPEWVMSFVNDKSAPLEEVARLTQATLANHEKSWAELHAPDAPDEADTFFVDEFQSDWHQHGRQEGYQGDTSEAGVAMEAAREEAERTRRIAHDAMADAGFAEGLRDALLSSMSGVSSTPEQATSLLEALGAPAAPAGVVDALVAHSVARGAFLEANDTLKVLRTGVPDAPFKNDAWIALGLKAAIVGAVEQGKDAFGWADSQTLVDRWSERYRKLYETQYDTKMVSLVKKLTGAAPLHFTLDGQPYPDAKLEEDIKLVRESLVAREQALEAQITGLPGFPADAPMPEQAMWVRASPDARGLDDEISAIREQRRNLRVADKPEGYWIIPLTPELKAKVEREAFPLFQNGEADPRGQLQIGADRRMAMTLFEGADLSTFLHESGHFFLEVLADIAADPAAPQQIRDDFAAIRRFVGNAGGPFTTEQHETWARGFEAYLREGRAPARELVGAFARFRRWLTDLYRSVGQLGVTLDPEIVAVMDRLIAVDEEIELATVQQGHAPVGDAATLGLSEAQWRTYTDMLAAATEEAREEVTAAVLRARQREQETAWREEAKRVRAELEDALERSPGFRAWRILTGRAPVGEPTTLEGVTLDRDALAEAYTAEQMKALRSLNVYRVEGGQHPDTAAGALGFDSGDALVQALLSVRPAQAALPAAVDAEMRRRHPDPAEDGSLPDRVTRALHRSRRVAVLEHELALLARLAQQPAPNARALRAVAEAAIARKTLRSLRPHDFLVAERKAAREATAAAAAGDFAKALAHKREQALQAALYSRASSAQDGARKQVEALRRAGSARTRERIGKAGKEYVDALDAMLEGHELRPVSARTVRRREALRAWVAAMQADNDETAVSEALLARVEAEQVTNVADLTLGELAELHEAVKNLLHLARLKNELLSNNDKRTWEEARTELLARIRQSLPEGEPLPLSAADLSTLERLSDTYGTLMDWVLQPETVAEWLDGGETGPWHDYLWNQAEAAQAKREELQRKVADPMQAILADMTAEQRRALNRRVRVRSMGRSLSRQTIISVALNLGNAGNRDKLMRGGILEDGVQVPITPEQLGDMLGHLTAADARMIQQVWDATNLLWPEIVAQQEALTGITPEKVQAEPVTLQTADGPVTLRGGYFPLVYDPRASSAGVKQAQAQEEKLFSGGNFTKAVTSKGHVVERTEYAAPVLLDYHAVLSRHLGNVITDLSHRRYVKQALRILSDGEIKGVIHQRLTGGAYHALLGSVRNAVVGGHTIAEPASRPVEKLRQGVMTNTAVAALGFKVALTVANMVSAPVQAAARVRPGYLIAGWARYYRHPVEQTRIIHELSPMMRARAEGHDTSYEEAIAGMRGQRGIRAKIVTVSLACHRWIVPLVERFVWMGRYMQAQADGSPMAEAIRLADKAIRQTQTKHAPKDLSAAERDPRYKIFNLFIGPLVVINNRMQDAGLRGKLRGKVETPAEALGTWLAMVAGGALIFEIMSGRGAEDEDEDGVVGVDEWLVWAAKKAAIFPMQTIPLVRNVANLFDGYHSARPDPVTDAMVAIAKAGKTAYAAGEDWLEGDDIDTEKVVIATARATGVAVGVPSSQAIVTGGYLWDVGTGAYTPDNPAEAAKYLIYRRPKDEQ